MTATPLVLVGDPLLTPEASALAQYDSTTRGFLMPRMTTTQRNALPSPATMLMIENVTTHTIDYYDGSAWQQIGTGSAGSFTSITLTGSGGAGYLSLPEQSAAPTFAANHVLLYADASNRPAWIGENNKTVAFDATVNAANAVYTLPNATDTLVGLTATQTLSNKTYGGVTLTLSGATDPTVAVEIVTADALAAATVSNKALTTNVATITTSAPHGFVTGQTVRVNSVDATFDGVFPITGTPLTTTFTYALVHADVVSAAASGTATLIHTPLTRVLGTTGAQVIATNSLGYMALGGATVSATIPLNIGATFTDPNAAVTGVNISPTVTMTYALATSPIVIGAAFNAILNQGSVNETAGAPGAARGFNSTARATGSSGIVTAESVVVTQIIVSGGGTLTTGYNFYALAPSVTTSTLTNAVAICVPAWAGATNNIIALWGTSTPPTGNWALYNVSSNPSSHLGNFGIGLAASVTPTNPLSLTGQSAQTIWMERQTTAATAGNNLTLQAGGAVSGGTDKNAGALLLEPGLSTGVGTGFIDLMRNTIAASTGSSDNTLVAAQHTPNPKLLANNTVTSLIDIALPTLTACGGTIYFTARCTDGTDVQSYSGITSFTAVNKGGVYTITAPTTDAANDNKSLSSGTLAVTWSVVSGTNKVTLKVNVNSSLTPSTGWPRITYVLINNSEAALTYL